MAKLFNRAKMTTATTGSGTVTLGSASNGFQTFAAAGVLNGDVVQYVIEEGANGAFEIGTGTYSSSGTSLTRSPTESSNSNNAITLAGQATVSITAVADDLNRLQHGGSDKVTVSSTGASVTGNLAVSGTVDGRDVASDGSKLDGIESGATADQTAAQIRAKVEAASDSNVFTDADHSKLNGIEAGATGDQTNAEIRAAVEAATDSNVFTDADHTKLNGIEANAKNDQTITAGGGLTGGGTGDVTISHSDTSSQASVNGSGRTYIQDITLDTYGHVTGLATATETVVNTDTNTIPNNATITLSAGGALTGGGNFTTDQSSNETITFNHSDTSSQSSVNNSGRTYIQDITLDGYGHVTGISSATETVTNTNTNQLTTFQVEDGDGTEVTISHGKEWKFTEAGGININWTDTSTGSDGDPFDLSFNVSTSITAGGGLTGGGALSSNRTISHADTSSQSSVNNSGRTYIQDITLDTYGHITGITSATETVTNTNTNQLTTFVVEDGDGTEVTISHGKEWKFVEGTAIDINWTDTSTGSDGDPFDLTISHTDTSTLSGTYGSTSNSTKIDQITVDAQGHVTAITTGGTGSMSSFNVQANGGTQVSITNGEEVNFVNGNATTAVVVNQTNPTVTFNHNDTSSQASVNNSGNTVIQDVTLDGYGHVTGLTSKALSIPAAAANATITLSAGTNLGGGGNFTTNQSSNETITFNLDSTIDVTEVHLGSEVQLRESTDRADLLQITSATSSWGGLQIRNSSNEGRWSFMTNGSSAGLYDDENNEWAIQLNENGSAQLYHNGVVNLTTGATYLEMGRHLDLNNYDIYGCDQLFHHGDTNTYMQFHAADQWRVVVGGSERLEVKNSSPHVLVSGDLNSTSDERLKKNIKPIDNALADICQLEGVRFDWRDTGTQGQGFIAQQVEPIIPDVVNTDEDTGMKSINYVGLIGHLVEAIKTQQTQIDELKAEIQSMKS